VSGCHVTVQPKHGQQEMLKIIASLCAVDDELKVMPLQTSKKIFILWGVCISPHVWLEFLWTLHIINKAIVDHTSPALCIPSPPSWPILNDPFCTECGSDGIIPSAAWCYWWLNAPLCSKRVTMHCKWGAKPPELPLPLGFHHPAGGGPSHGHRQHAQKNLVIITCMALEICTWTDRQSDAHHNTSLSLLWAK